MAQSSGQLSRSIPFVNKGPKSMPAGSGRTSLPARKSNVIDQLRGSKPSKLNSFKSGGPSALRPKKSLDAKMAMPKGFTKKGY